MFEVLEVGGTLLVIIIMLWVNALVFKFLTTTMERLYAEWKRGTTSKRITAYQLAVTQTPECLRETYVNFADLAR